MIAVVVVVDVVDIVDIVDSVDVVDDVVVVVVGVVVVVVVVVVLIARSCGYMTPSPKLPAPHLQVAVQSTSPAPRVAPHRAPSKDVTLRSPWRASRWRCFDEGELHTKSLVYLRGTGWASGWNMVGSWEEILWSSHLEDHPRTGKWLIPMVNKSF